MAVTQSAEKDVPTWVEGWVAAMDWLAEYKGFEGIALAEEMATRLPSGHAERVAQMTQHARDVFAADMDDAPDGGERQ